MGRRLGLAGLLLGCQPTPAVTAAAAPAPRPPTPAPLALPGPTAHAPSSAASPPAAAPDIPASPVILASPDILASPERERLLVASLAELGRSFAELDELDQRIEDGDEPLPRGARKRRRELLAAIDRLRDEARAQVTGATSPKRLAPRVFAPIVAELAANAQGRFQPLIHPELGLFVIHNMSGSTPHLDRVRIWKQDEDGQPYPRIDQESVLVALSDAMHWRLGRKPHEDESGCPQLPDDIQERTRNATAFDSWGVVLGWDGWTAIPDRYRLMAMSSEAAEGTGLAGHYDAGAHAAMQRAALAISHTAIVGGAHLDFGRIDDRWYLLAIDIYDDACG